MDIITITLWIILNAIVPILGPFLFSAIGVWLFLSQRKDRRPSDIFSNQRLNRLSDPRGVLYFNITSSASTFYILLVNQKWSDHFWIFLGSGLICLICFIAIVSFTNANYVDYIEPGVLHIPDAGEMVFSYGLAFIAAFLSFSIL